MTMNFSFESPGTVVFGKGAVNRVGKLAATLGKRALLVTVPEFDALAPLFAKVKQLLKEAGLEVFHYDGVVPNPTTESIEAGVEMALANNIDLCIGLGGGSSIDTAKAIALTAPNGGKPWDYLFYKKQPDKALPIIAITTTSGTGSQCTNIAVLTQTSTHTKTAMYGRLIVPRYAIVDPELMRTVPPFLTASTGFDTFAHCFEGLVNVKASPITDAIALQGIKLVAKHLVRAYKNGDDMEAREGMAAADTCGGITIANTGTSLPHGIGMQTTGHVNSVAHGVSLAIVYPDYMRFAKDIAKEKFAQAARMFDESLYSKSDDYAADACCEIVEQLLRNIDLYKGFREFGVDRETMEKIAQRGQELPEYLSCPRVATLEEIRKIVFDSETRQ